MSDPIDCTECWNGDDCELHPSAPVTDDSNDVGPAIKAYTIQEKRHEKELTKFKTERDALEKRCELQLETIRDLRLQLDLVTEDRQVEIETRQRLQGELARAQSTLKSWQSGYELSAEVDQLKADLAQAKAEDKELRAELDDFKALCGKLNDTGNAVSDELAHAIEVKNRCVASVNRLCSQVVELQAQLKDKE